MATDYTQFPEQIIKQRVTISAGATTLVSVNVPVGNDVFLKGYGYTWYTSNEFILSTGNTIFPKRTDQEGSAATQDE